jgi:hypothetical protein
MKGDRNTIVKTQCSNNREFVDVPGTAAESISSEDAFSQHLLGDQI